MCSAQLNDLFQEATDRLVALGFRLVPFDPIVHVDRRATVRLGSCRRRPDGVHQVGISPWVIATENQRLIADVLAHEACHLVEGAMNHGSLWKEAAKQMHDHYGYTITRTYAKNEAPVQQYKYAVQCTKCGVLLERMKKSKVIQSPAKYRCGKCHGKLKRIR